MNVLIIGGNGALGQTLTDVYRDLQPTVWNKTDLDISDERAVWDKINQSKPDLVFNCAAVSDYDEAETDRVKTESINGYGAGNIAKACQSVGAKLIYYSCVSVFEGDKPNGNVEDDVTAPINELGRSKVVGEIETTASCDDSYIVRSSLLFGPKTFIEHWIELAKAQQPIYAAEDEIVNPTYLLDLAQATRAMVEVEKEFGIYHVMNTGAVSKYEFANYLLNALSSPQKAVAVKKDAQSLLARRPKHQILNNTKFLELRPWAEAIDEFLQTVK